MTGQQCIRRPGSQWTLCDCQPCRQEMRRKVKLRRNGIRVHTDQRAAARARVDAWVKAGFSVGVIAQLTGVRKATLERHMHGSRRSMSHQVAARVMAAPDTLPDRGGFVSSVGVSRRLRALTRMGWSMGELAARCDIKESTLHGMRDPAHRFTRPGYAQTVARLYDELAMTQGPCQYAATRAKNRGWPAPLDWDNIDDPSEDPSAHGDDGDDIDEIAVELAMGGRAVALTPQERNEALRRLVAAGLSDTEVGARIGVVDRTVLRWRQQNGVASTWAA